MRLVVADTAPLNYLVLIGCVDLLPTLFEKVFIPEAVRDELRHVQAPDPVREWIADAPRRIEIVASTLEASDPEFDRLDDGERAAIELAISVAVRGIADMVENVAALRHFCANPSRRTPLIWSALPQHQRHLISIMHPE